jgi:Na+/proline symporter
MSMLGLHWLDILVIVLYFAFMAGIGLVAYLRVRTQGDYFLGRRKFGKAMMIMFAFGSGTHADTAVGVAAKSYGVGLAGIWYQWQQLLTTAFYWLLAPVFRRARCVTTSDFFERRYGIGFGLLYTLDAVFMNIGFMGVMLYGSGRMIESLTGQAVPLGWAIAIMIVCFTIYGVAGGLVAAVWTDFFQGILTIIMSFMLVPFMWHAVGGRAGLREALPNFNEVFSLRVAGEIGVFWVLMNAINSLVSVVVQPHIMANTAAGKTEMEGRVGFVFGILIKRLCTVPWALVGVMGIALYANQGVHGDHVFGQAVRDYLPVGMVGLMVACIMASVMSTCDVLMISSSALLTRNIYGPFFAKGREEEHMVRFARLFSICFVALAVGLASLFESMPEAMRFLWKTVPLIGISFFLALWWRRATRYGAWASFLVALGAMLYGQFFLGLEGDANLPYLMALYLGSGFLAGILVSLITPREQERRLDEFYVTINTPVGQEKILEDNNIEIIMR